MNEYQKLIGLPFQKDDGIEMELTTKEDCLNEITELRKAINSILVDLNKFKGMKAYNGDSTLGRFETKYIEDAVLICENQLDVRYVFNSDKDVHGSVATDAASRTDAGTMKINDLP